MARNEAYIDEQRARATAIWNALNEMKSSAQLEWNANAYGDTLPDGIGGNAGITKAEVGAVVFDTVDALMTVLTANNNAHAGNLGKLLL